MLNENEDLFVHKDFLDVMNNLESYPLPVKKSLEETQEDNFQKERQIFNAILEITYTCINTKQRVKIVINEENFHTYYADCIHEIGATYIKIKCTCGAQHNILLCLL